MPSLTPIVQALLIANGIVYLGQLLLPLEQLFALWPIPLEGSRMDLPGYRDGHFLPWQLITYGFMHGNNMHLLLNMFGVYMFGSHIERLWGSYHFLIYYFVCLIGAGVVQLVLASLAARTGYPYATVGASGALFGLLLAFGMMYPNNIIMLLFPPIPMKAKYFVIGYGLLELWLGLTMPQSTVAHFAHLGGMVFGLVLIQYWRGKFPLKPRWILRR